MEQLPPSLLLPALVITISFLSAAVGIIGYFLKDIKTSQKEKDEKQDEEIKSVKKDLADFKAQLPLDYVLRDDFVREISTFNRKMDRVIREVSGLVRAVGGKNCGGETDA